jgi:hypothetical protein
LSGFHKNDSGLGDIREGTLDDLLMYIMAGLKSKNATGNVGKTAQNIMYAFHRMMKQAKRDGRIQSIPLFPEKEDYDCDQRLRFPPKTSF